MFIDAQSNNYSKELKFFLLLKLIYPCGKAQLNNEALQFIELVENISSRKTTNKYINFLMEIGWIDYNQKTQFHIFKSFDRIRKENNWEVRLAFQIDFNNYYKIKAVTGAVIYGYLHKDFWRKVKKQKSVQLKGSTYYFLSPKFNYKEEYAPVSVNGVTQLFNISTATASRLKNEAFNEGLIKLKKNYSKTLFNKKFMQYYLDYNDMKQNIVFNDGSYRLQLIDTLYPLFYFSKRKSL
ncbi:hypothetical protein D778_02383 [Xanthomarina gelatinilytica]|uniref:Uncharacterized protein n=1 Tax=Xanthomarina gelatinilytica TaxID=1137281 RepID=M7N1C4_9FLAO|nr:hypothetical protein [Xanthomarina gelatinilytica]EMQ95549.1 hypothetical protein D778_02383 [Xanthomarina gelatinilytica]